MSESAETTGRADRRQRMRHRISLTAQRLVDDRGLDGFTMDDLAAALDVSRRTLFNYYPTKVDAVLGPEPVLDDEHWATFVAGGPHGDLVEDLIVLAGHVLQDKDLTREEMALGRRIMLAEPRLLAAVHERMAVASADLGQLLVERTGHKTDLATAQLIVRVLAATFEAALDQLLAPPPGSPEPAPDDLAPDALARLVAENIRALRDLFTGPGTATPAPPLP